MKNYLIVILLLFITLSSYGEIAGDVSIGKDGEIGKANIRLGYDFEFGDITLIPFIDYINYYYFNGIMGNPYRDIYRVGIKIEYKDIYIQVDHQCIHEVSSENINGKPVLYDDARMNESCTFVTVGYCWGRDF